LIDGWIDYESMFGWIHWMDGCMDRWFVRWMDGWMDGWIDEWIGGWMVWMDGLMVG
jgi:hypothetical protein